MNIKRNIRVATIAAVAVAVASISAPAMASIPTTSSAMTLSHGPVKPTVTTSSQRSGYFSAGIDIPIGG